MKQLYRAIFYIPQGVHLLDLAGAVQAFHEAGDYDQPYEIIYVSGNPSPLSSAGLPMAGLTHFSNLHPRFGDLLLIPGFEMRLLAAQMSNRLNTWLQMAAQHNATICSICTGAFLLAEAGLLNNKECTTHWKYTARLQTQYPKTKVLTDRLFVKNATI